MPEASAAVAAAQLLALCKEPVRLRPRLTHGRETPPVGLHAFRFAQGKFPNGLLRELPLQERERLRNAANLFIRQVCFWEGATHYQVLCVRPDARRETIKEHYHVLIALIHPDRQDAESGSWPPQAAHRVNLAYAVLSDADKRADYDASLLKARADRAQGEAEHPVPETASLRVPVVGRVAAARMRLRKPALLVTAALAGLFFAYTWQAADVPGQYAMLEASTPLEASIRFARNVFSTSDRPSYLADGGGLRDAASGTGDSADRQEQESFLTPFWRMLTGEPQERPAVALTGRPPPVPAPASPPVTAPPEDAPRVPDSAVGAATPSQAGPMAAAPVRVPALPARPSPPVGAATNLSEVAQASIRGSLAEPVLAPIDMEAVVASVIGYYEAGDLERLLGLLDVQSITVMEAVRLRRDFKDFFESTKSRRLQLQGISWEREGEVARAKGLAGLQAEFRGEPGKVERQVPLELEVRVRGGQPRITHLSLFPHP